MCLAASWQVDGVAILLLLGLVGIQLFRCVVDHNYRAPWCRDDSTSPKSYLGVFQITTYESAQSLASMPSMLPARHSHY
jgi:hypothetical protein